MINNRAIYDFIKYRHNNGEKIFALLIDPEKFNADPNCGILEAIRSTPPDLIFVGGSQYNHSISATVYHLKCHTDIPIVMFPGNCTQFSENVDCILFLSLLSGRNPEYLIEQQIAAAPAIKSANIETISTGYILIDGGKHSAVEIVSGTSPYHTSDIDLITATAQAGELMGNGLIYLEAGSGAEKPVPQSVISAVRKATEIPLIVGGGLKTPDDIRRAISAGADIIVVGNHLEQRPEHLPLLIDACRNKL